MTTAYPPWVTATALHTVDISACTPARTQPCSGHLCFLWCISPKRKRTSCKINYLLHYDDFWEGGGGGQAQQPKCVIIRNKFFCSTNLKTDTFRMSWTMRLIRMLSDGMGASHFAWKTNRHESLKPCHTKEKMRNSKKILSCQWKKKFRLTEKRKLPRWREKVAATSVTSCRLCNTQTLNSCSTLMVYKVPILELSSTV